MHQEDMLCTNAIAESIGNHFRNLLREVANDDNSCHDGELPESLQIAADHMLSAEVDLARYLIERFEREANEELCLDQERQAALLAHDGIQQLKRIAGQMHGEEIDLQAVNNVNIDSPLAGREACSLSTGAGTIDVTLDPEIVRQAVIEAFWEGMRDYCEEMRARA